MLPASYDLLSFHIDAPPDPQSQGAAIIRPDELEPVAHHEPEL